MDNSETKTPMDAEFNSWTKEQLASEVLRFREAERLHKLRRRRLFHVAWNAILRAFGGRRLYQDVLQFFRSWDHWLVSGPVQGSWPKDETYSLAAALVNRLLLIGIFGITIAAVPVLVLLTQTLILHGQNQILSEQSNLLKLQVTQSERQNNLAAYGHTSGLRQELYLPPSDSFGDQQHDAGDPAVVPSKQPAPNRTTISRIVLMAETEPEIVVSALQTLLQDEASVVSAGALIALHKISRRNNTQVDASGARLRRANLAGTYDLAMTTSPSTFGWTRLDLTGTLFAQADLLGADLRMADLSYASFRNANLIETNLSGALLIHTDLSHAVLNRSNLIHADLQFANLNEAQLIDAIMLGASFRATNFAGANLTGANLTEAVFLTGVNSLCEAQSLANIQPPELRDRLFQICPGRFHTEK